ncbi:hypothetical protein QNH20_12770 [Neobacillus sp. WH10]|uniref:hypothetical protein n=1 Tax=Neobacillus sp. WH10 TaxID=3047873 RepID=UPI0024C1C7EA|nr:hypothetical protein [Neobacillus sp. WH10]WHY79954.1 hypothetical protein QNH20_12770 [Neobacillus sp. WH10]
MKQCTDMNETVNAPYLISFGFGFWATLRREAFFSFFALLVGVQPFSRLGNLLLSLLTALQSPKWLSSAFLDRHFGD